MAEESNARLAFERISSLLNEQAKGLDSSVDFRTSESFHGSVKANTGISGRRGPSFTASGASFSFNRGAVDTSTRREETLNTEWTFGGDTATMPMAMNESEEEHFHSTLAAFLAQGNDTNELVGVRMEGKDFQAEISSDYSVKAGLSHEEAVRRLQMADMAMQDVPPSSSSSTSFSGSRSGEAMRRRKRQEVGETRAERDMWSLLDIFSRAELLVNIIDDECAQKASDAISSLAPNTPSAVVQNVALEADLRVKKGRVLCEWLEYAARDLVQELSELEEPWERTLNSHVLFAQGTDSNTHPTSASNRVTSVHPDAQLTLDTGLLSLEDGDHRQQEALLKALWQLIRSGQVTAAQQVAWDAKVFWLASSLSGVAEHYYEAESLSGDNHNLDVGCSGMNMDVDDRVLRVPSRRGNVRRPVWLRTCWLYSDKLASNSGNWKGVRRRDSAMLDAGMNALYEMTIYAALSCNVPVLLKSPCISSWSDRLWVLIKATHERDVANALRAHRDRKMRHSQLYPECHPALIEAEAELAKLGESAGLSSLGVGGGKGVEALLSLSCLPSSPVTGEDIDTEAVLLQLQAMIIRGPDGLNAFLLSHVAPILTTCADFYRGLNLSATQAGPLLLSPFPGSARLLRVFAHLAVWLRYSNEDTSCDLQRELSNLTDALFYSAVECYIEHLIFTKQCTLVASYACFLSQARRVQAYTKLLTSLPAPSAKSSLEEQEEGGGERDGAAAGEGGLDHPAAVEILQLARQSFCADDVKQIVTAFAKASREGRAPLFSASMPLTGQQTTHTSSSGATGSTLYESRERDPTDAASIDSLKWLFIDPSHRLEAVNQANKLIVRLVCQERSIRPGHKEYPLNVYKGEKLGSVALLLSSSHFPDDSEAIGTGMLRELKGQVEQDLADVDITKDGHNDANLAVLEAEMQELLLQEAQWGVNWRQLHFWRSFLTTMADTEQFYAHLTAFKGASSNVGHRAQIERSAENVINSVLATITGKPQQQHQREEEGQQQQDWLSSTGCMEIWHDAEALAVRTARHAVDVFLSDEKTPKLLGEEGSAGYTDLAPCATLREKLTTLESAATRLFDPATSLSQCAALTTPVGPTGQGPRVISRQLELLHMTRGLLFDTIAAVEQCDDSEGKAATRYHLRVTVDKIAESLKYVEECRNASVSVVLSLLHVYSRVCLEAGSALEQIKLPSFAHQWYANGVKLAPVLADSHPALQLSLCLPRVEIERLLSDINACSLKSVDLRGVFDLTNE